MEFVTLSVVEVGHNVLAILEPSSTFTNIHQHSIMVNGLLSFDEPRYKIFAFAILSSLLMLDPLNSQSLVNVL